MSGLVAVVAAWGVVQPSGAQSQPQSCSTNCAQLSVTGATGTPGGTVTIGVAFTQGPDDGEAAKGNDETAAIAFTLGIPGVGSATPLSLADCTVGSDGLTPAIKVADAIKDTFKVVLENLQCTTVTGTPRNRCLCPGAEQQRDNFINVVVYGPKDLPASGPVDIPVLPSGSLMTIDLKIDAAGTTPVHVFAETDNQSEKPKPQFGAFLSIGDKSAVDQTFNSERTVSKVAITNAAVSAGTACVGDCDSSNDVTVDELVKGVNIALGTAQLTDCPSFDKDNSGDVTVDELVTAVNYALGSCPS
ncbi:MAG: hypothetical protein HY699_13385 [Deltaproteobacteria bacterium]|nr:hypothetical protein [Deltaproteobacteria bacterium]